MELQSGQEVLANELEQQQATLVVSELAESEQAALEGSLDAPQVSGGELGSEVHYANADLGDLIGDEGQTSKLNKVFDSGLKGDAEYVAADEDGSKRKAKSDLKRESIEEKKQLQKEEQKIEKRAVIKFLTLRGKSGAKIHRQLKEVYGDQAPSLRNVNFWRLQFLRGGRLRLRNAEKCGRRATATTQENIEAARNYIDLNPHAKISDVGKEIGVSHGTAFRILHEHLKLQNFGGKWIPASLKVDGQLHPAGGDSLVYTNYEADSGLQEHFVYAPSAGPRRHGNGSHAQLVAMHARGAQILGATSSQRGMRASVPRPQTHTQRVLDASGKQPVSVVTVHPRARRGGSAGAARRNEYVKSEMDEMNAMVTDYFELDDAAQQAEQGAEGEGGEGEGDGQSGSMVMGVGPDGNLYVVAVGGEGAEGGEHQDATGGYVVQETSGYVVEETNYINYPETSM